LIEKKTLLLNPSHPDCPGHDILKPMKLFSKSITPKQATDAGMAVVLLLLLAGLATREVMLYRIALAALVVNMIVPAVYRPFAWFWFGLANLLGWVSSRILLTLIYFLVVFPVGMVRRLMGKDPLQLKGFRHTEGSAMNVRDHLFIREDMEHPY